MIELTAGQLALIVAGAAFAGAAGVILAVVIAGLAIFREGVRAVGQIPAASAPDRAPSADRAPAGG